MDFMAWKNGEQEIANYHVFTEEEKLSIWSNDIHWWFCFSQQMGWRTWLQKTTQFIQDPQPWCITRKKSPISWILMKLGMKLTKLGTKLAQGYSIDWLLLSTGKNAMRQQCSTIWPALVHWWSWWDRTSCRLFQSERVSNQLTQTCWNGSLSNSYC